MELKRNLIIRNDDVNFNTNPKKLGEIYGAIHSILPDAEIWSVISIFGGRNSKGAVYGDLPLKDKDVNWFYKHSDCVMGNFGTPLFKVASHGLFHIDHSVVSRQTQEMSILSSCALLKTNLFIPPFNRSNQDTADICFDNDITLVSGGWKSMDCEKFDLNHRLWYLHSWRWTAEKLKDYLYEWLQRTKDGPVVGQLQKPIINGT